MLENPNQYELSEYCKITSSSTSKLAHGWRLKPAKCDGDLGESERDDQSGCITIDNLLTDASSWD